MAGLRWSRRERLRYLEALAYWRGWFRRSDLMQQFGIGVQHVSADIAEYIRLNPRAITYDGRKKLYLATAGMKLILAEPKIEEALTLLGQRPKDAGPWFDIVRLPERRLQRTAVQMVFRAVAAGRSLRVRYASLNSKSFRWRWITPHAFASDGYRWHVRAFCHEDRTFKDFVLGRIASAGPDGEPEATPRDDQAWRRHRKIVLTSATGTTPAETRALELDFGMQRGCLAFAVRDSLRLYALAQAGLSENGKTIPVRFRLLQ